MEVVGERKKFKDGGHVGHITISEGAFWFSCACGYSGDTMASRKQAEIQGADHALAVWPEVARALDRRSMV